jgi:hypothetical protein
MESLLERGWLSTDPATISRFRQTSLGTASRSRPFLLVGPNFGDQGIKEHSTYRPAPQVSYAVGTKVSREAATSVSGTPQVIQASPMRWAAIDDNYFAMALVPARPAGAVALFNVKKLEDVGGKQVEQNYVFGCLFQYRPASEITSTPDLRI